METISLIVANNIRRERERKGFSQKGLAKKAKINPVTLNRIENGKQRAGPSSVQAIADALGVSIDALYGRTLDPESIAFEIADVVRAWGKAAPHIRSLALDVLQSDEAALATLVSEFQPTKGSKES